MTKDEELPGEATFNTLRPRIVRGPRELHDLSVFVTYARYLVVAHFKGGLIVVVTIRTKSCGNRMTLSLDSWTFDTVLFFGTLPDSPRSKVLKAASQHEAN